MYAILNNEQNPKNFLYIFIANNLTCQHSLQKIPNIIFEQYEAQQKTSFEWLSIQ